MRLMTQVLTVALFIVMSNTGFANVSTNFIFPVLGDGLSIMENRQDPRLRGWYTWNYFGHSYPKNPLGGAAKPYHPGEDWNRYDGRENAGNEPVYSIADYGYVVRVVTDGGIGGSVLVRYKLPNITDFSSYFFPGTTPWEKYERGEYVLVQYAHIRPEAHLKRGQEVSLGQELGKILPGADYKHLHLDIAVIELGSKLDVIGGENWTTSRNKCGYYESHQAITNDGYINPTKFIKSFHKMREGTDMVGVYSDGWHEDSQPYSQPFQDCYIAARDEETKISGKGLDIYGLPTSPVTRRTPNIYAQEYNMDGIRYTMVLNPYVHNINRGYLGVCYPIGGRIRVFWNPNRDGAPVTNEYYIHRGGVKYAVQWFEVSDNNYKLLAYGLGNNLFLSNAERMLSVSRGAEFEQRKKEDREKNDGVGGASEPKPLPTPTPTLGSSQSSNPFMDCQGSGVWGTVSNISNVGSWEKLSDNSFPALFYFAYAADLKGNILLYGGFTTQNGKRVYSYDTWYYNGSNWNKVTPPSNRNVSPRSQTAICYDQGRHEFILVGGDNPNSDIHYSDVWAWRNNGWTRIINNGARRVGHSLTWSENIGQIVMYGGTNGSSSFFKVTLTFF